MGNKEHRFKYTINTGGENRVLNQNNSQLIAVIINSHREFKESILGDPFYGQILGHIEMYVQKLGYYVMFYSAKDIDKIFSKNYQRFSVAGRSNGWEVKSDVVLYRGIHFIDRGGKKRYNQQYSKQIYVTAEYNLQIALRRLYYVSRP